MAFEVILDLVHKGLFCFVENVFVHFSPEIAKGPKYLMLLQEISNYM